MQLERHIDIDLDTTPPTKEGVGQLLAAVSKGSTSGTLHISQGGEVLHSIEVQSETPKGLHAAAMKTFLQVTKMSLKRTSDQLLFIHEAAHVLRFKELTDHPVILTRVEDGAELQCSPIGPVSDDDLDRATVFGVGASLGAVLALPDHMPEVPKEALARLVREFEEVLPCSESDLEVLDKAEDPTDELAAGYACGQRLVFDDALLESADAIIAKVMAGGVYQFKFEERRAN